MKMQLKWRAVIAIVLVFLSVTACSQRNGQPEQQFLDRCDKMKNYIEQAQAIASDLENFNWNEFSNVGILYPPEGICPVGNLPIVEKSSVNEAFIERWVPLVEQLPSPQTARTYSIQCASCLKLADEICSHSPYNEPQTHTPEAEKLTLTQWQELCGQLQSALTAAEYLAFRDKTIAAEYTFPRLLAYFTDSDEKIKQKYLNKFVYKSDKYIQLHAELINNIQQAEQVASELSNWQSSSQGSEEE
ncbi:MAG: hypothetical protein JXB43_06875 [Dehalococcoidia bacterium]|nr:hypothetical protein [Dehalococcoidia bacterium]